MKTLTVKKETRGNPLHHLEVHVPKRAGHGHLVMHHFMNEGGEYHPPEPHAFGANEGEEALAHIAKHAKIRTETPQTEGIGKEEGGEGELENVG